MKLNEVVFLVAGLLSFTATAQPTAPTMLPTPAGGLSNAMPAMLPPPVAPDKDLLSTAVGVYYAHTMTNELAGKLGVDAKADLDFNKLLQNFSNYVMGVSGTISYEDAGKVLQQQFTYQRSLAQEEIKKMTDAGPQTKLASEKFIDGIEGQPGMTKLASGVVYKVIKDGNGDSPAAQDGATVSFKATKIDGTEVASIDHKTVPLTPTAITPGLSQALQLMKVGAHWMVYLPYSQAFDDKPQFQDAKHGFKLPPYSALIFDVTLEGVQHRPAAPPPGATSPGTTATPAMPQNVTSSSIVRVPSAEDMKKGEQPRVLTDEEVRAAQKEAMDKARTNAAAGTNAAGPK